MSLERSSFSQGKKDPVKSLQESMERGSQWSTAATEEGDPKAGGARKDSRGRGAGCGGRECVRELHTDEEWGWAESRMSQMRS